MKKFNVNQFAMLTVLAVGLSSQVAYAGKTPTNAPAPTAQAAQAQGNLREVGQMAESLQDVIGEMKPSETTIKTLELLQDTARELGNSGEDLEKAYAQVGPTYKALIASADRVSDSKGTDPLAIAEMAKNVSVLLKGLEPSTKTMQTLGSLKRTAKQAADTAKDLKQAYLKAKAKVQKLENSAGLVAKIS